MTPKNFVEDARAWLVRAQGYARVEHEQSLAEELRRVYELGAARAIDAINAQREVAPIGSQAFDDLVWAIRDAGVKDSGR